MHTSNETNDDNKNKEKYIFVDAGIKESITL